MLACAAMVIMFVDRDLLEFFLYFLSVSYEKLYFVFEMVQVASLILDEGKQIKLLQQLIADILLSKSISKWQIKLEFMTL